MNLRLNQTKKPSSKKNVVVIAMCFTLSIAFGLLATTASPVIIGLGVGIVLGPILLLSPQGIIWIVLLIGFLFGVLSANPQFAKLTWIISLLSMMLFIPAFTSVYWKKNTKLPGFIFVGVFFLTYCVTTSAINWYSPQEFIAGFKRYFQSFGVMFALALISFDLKQFKRWKFFLLVVALLQFPFALYELVVLVPLRGGVAASSASTDVVAGTFGANLQGGSPNSVMVTFLFIIISFTVARWRLGLIENRKFWVLMIIFFLPLGMGETKIAVIMLPLVGLILLRKDFVHAPMRYFSTLIIVGMLTVGLAYVYVTVLMHSSIDSVIHSTLRYNVGDQGYAKGQFLNRLTAVEFWWKQQHLGDPLQFFFGNGLGSSFSSESIVSGHIGMKFLHYGINLTAASTLLWDTGLFGLILFLALFLAAWFSASKLYISTDEISTKADALGIQAAIGLFVLNIFYSDSIVNLVSMELIYAVVLGYLGYLINKQKDNNKFSITKE